MPEPDQARTISNPQPLTQWSERTILISGLLRLLAAGEIRSAGYGHVDLELRFLRDYLQDHATLTLPRSCGAGPGLGRIWSPEPNSNDPDRHPYHCGTTGDGK